MHDWTHAYALAAALLDGPWDPAPMAARILAALSEPPAPADDVATDPDAWIYELVDEIHARYPTPPHHSLRRLACAILEAEAFDNDERWSRRVTRYATPAPAMGRMPWPVPGLADHHALATWLGITGNELTALADIRGISRAGAAHQRHYRYAWIRKPNGGHRLVEAPKPRLRAVQRAVLDGIVARVPPHDAAYGFRAGRSVVDAAAQHVGRAVVMRVDLVGFFSSIRANQVAAILRSAGYPDDTAHTLAALTTHRTPPDVLATAPADARAPLDLARLRTAHLPQGAPTSGALANLAAYGLDVRITALAARLDATYTRYADDLVLSGDRTLIRAATSIVARLAAIAADEGFAINFRKTRVMTAATRQRITGIVVNDKLGTTRADVDRLRAILHNCRRDGPASQNRDQLPDFRAHLRGRIAWVSQLDPAKGARLRAAFDDICWD
ncbi:MAG TPA: reverse transcriptase family protein [Kofleriaceae bacterium]|nr:reverse transcriptase family protein [Kofleriaceae bacterium]